MRLRSLLFLGMLIGCVGGDLLSSDGYRRDIEDLIASENETKVCPFDGLPCEYVSSCDDVLSVQFGRDMVEGDSCPRAKFRGK